MDFKAWLKQRFGIFVLKDKPYALSHKGWKEWDAAAKKEQPIAYWIHEVCLDWIGDQWKYKIKDPINNTRYAIRHRLFDRYNIIHTKLKPDYYDSDTRMLHGMFELLVDFVEVEKAWMHVVFNKDAQKARKHPWWSRGWTRFKAFRDPIAGLDHLVWEMSLDNPELPATERSEHQAEAAREIFELYNWWKNIRPNRPDPHDASGWSEHCDKKRDMGIDLLDFEDESADYRAESAKILDKLREIEESQEQEDTDMLIRLIKIRKSLWT
jgi:hypothetical protein